METWGIKEWGVIASIIISLTSIGLVVYKDFIQGSMLKTVLNSIVFIKIAENNKSEVLLQIILDDMLSGRPSDQATTIIEGKSEIKDAIRQRNRELTKNALLSYSMELANLGMPQLIYNANPESIIRYFGNKNFAISFYAPINIVNVGRKTGDITSIILKITSTIEDSKVWVYSCFTEIKPEELLNFNNPNQPIGHYVGKIFPGISIGPSYNQRLDLFLIPIDTNRDRIISNSSLIPGKYKVKLYGYNSLNNKCLESNEGLITINQNTLVDLFNGTNIVQNLTMENHIDNLIK
jgi:hypothetical protein